MTKTRLIFALALLGTPLLASCGLRGDLQTPPPLIGEDSRTEAEKAQAQEAEQALRERREKDE